jgi:hypothetical protein
MNFPAGQELMLHVRQLELESNVTWSIKTEASKLTIGFTRNLSKKVETPGGIVN